MEGRQQSQSSNTVGQQYTHPLALLGEDEIKAASTILLKHIQEQDRRNGSETKVHFKNISLHDPPKSFLLPHLDAEAAGIPCSERPYVPRCVDIIWSKDSQRKVTESTIDLNTKTIIGEINTKKGQYGPNDRFDRTTLKFQRSASSLL